MRTRAQAAAETNRSTIGRLRARQPDATSPHMKGISAAVLALTCSLAAVSCLQSPESSTEPDETGSSFAAEPAASGEPTGEAREPLPIVSYKPADFPFVTVVPDDGREMAGGWQVAKATLDFWNVVFPHRPTRWQCSLTIGMPLRTRVAGPIPPSHAAMLGARVAEDAARAMDYSLPPGIFCHKFVDGMQALFKSRYPALGATVTR